MAADQQFCLRWNNHQSTLISVFDTLLENGTLVDCTLAAEGQYLKAHKVVLSACSPYMETLLSQNYDKHPILILKDVKFTELKSMMDYMYRGEVNISQDQLGTFLKAAESLQIKGLSENGEGDARDVGSTNANPPPPRRPPATRPEPEAAQSPAHRSRDGSVSPSSRKRRRLRRNSDDGDNHIESNSCDVPAQSTPVPNIPASITTTPIRTPIVKPEVNDRLDHNTLPAESGLLKEKIEPAEPLLEPKTEYLEDLNNDDSVEDLTLDDDDEMDMSQMSNLSNMSRPGPSHGADLSNQGFPPWQLGNQSGTDEVFMAAQEAVNAHRDSQGQMNARSLRLKTLKTVNEKKVSLVENLALLRQKKDEDLLKLISDHFNKNSNLTLLQNKSTRAPPRPSLVPDRTAAKNVPTRVKKAKRSNLKLKCLKELRRRELAQKRYDLLRKKRMLRKAAKAGPIDKASLPLEDGAKVQLMPLDEIKEEPNHVPLEDDAKIQLMPLDEIKEEPLSLAQPNQKIMIEDVKGVVHSSFLSKLESAKAGPRRSYLDKVGKRDKPSSEQDTSLPPQKSLTNGIPREEGNLEPNISSLPEEEPADIRHTQTNQNLAANDKLASKENRKLHPKKSNPKVLKKSVRFSLVPPEEFPLEYNPPLAEYELAVDKSTTKIVQTKSCLKKKSPRKDLVKSPSSSQEKCTNQPSDPETAKEPDCKSKTRQSQKKAPPTEYICDCGAKYKLKTLLKRHKSFDCNKGPYVCPICSMAFHERDQVENHIEFKHRESYLCPYCPQNCKYLEEVKDHVKTEHTPAFQKWYSTYYQNLFEAQKSA